MYPPVSAINTYTNTSDLDVAPNTPTTNVRPNSSTPQNVTAISAGDSGTKDSDYVSASTTVSALVLLGLMLLYSSLLEGHHPTNTNTTPQLVPTVHVPAAAPMSISYHQRPVPGPCQHPMHQVAKK